MDPYDQYHYTGVARELKELRDRLMYYRFETKDFGILDRAITSLERLLELYLEMKQKEGKELTVEPSRRGCDTPHYINAVRYAKQIGAEVPDEVWDSLQAGIEEWNDILTNFEYKDKQGLVLNIEFTKDGNLTKFDFRPAFAARPPLNPKMLSFFDPDTGDMMDIPKECVCNRGGETQEPEEDVEEEFIEKLSTVLDQALSTALDEKLSIALDQSLAGVTCPSEQQSEYDVVEEAMDEIEDAILSIDDNELQMRIAVELLNTLDELEGVAESTIPVAHTDFFKMTHELLENRKTISILKQAIADHKLGIESQALGNVAANKELWRYLNG